MMAGFEVVEATIPQMRAALERGETTSVKLVQAYLARLEAYDRQGPWLNAVPVLNDQALTEARESDARRAGGQARGPLEGIPYTAKESYQAAGLTVAAGSPAFLDLIAQRDSFTVARLRAAGAVLIGLTTMPPMANGGMQRGVRGRAESPYTAEYLTAAFGSGSSNGSGTATAASFSAFGLAEETWSSGRAPASNNGLCAYTPSWGMISIRGNWPLVPTMDVVVPHTRTMEDMLELLDVIVADDAETRGDFWRVQPWVEIPKASEVRPESFTDLRDDEVTSAVQVLQGLRVGAPAMYLGLDASAGTAAPSPEGVTGIGGSTGQPIIPRPSVLALWEQARQDLEGHGVEVRVTDLPVVTNYEGDRPGAPTIRTRGLVSPAYLDREILDLSAWAWDDFLRANGDPGLPRLAEVDGRHIVPHPEGALPDRYRGFDDDIAGYPRFMRDHPELRMQEIPHLAEGLHGLVRTREIDFEEWMDRLGLDVVVFPAVADVAPADADVDPESAELAWRNGVWVANGNLVWRHLGIPTVTVPMGTMADTGMPVGLTFAGRSYDDVTLLRVATAFEATGRRRAEPTRTPRLEAL